MNILTRSSRLLPAIILFLSAGTIWAQNRYAICFNSPFAESRRETSYFTKPFTIPAALANKYGRTSGSQEPAASFRKEMIDHYSLSTRKVEYSNGWNIEADDSACDIFASLSQASSALQQYEDFDRTTYHRLIREIPWIYAPSKQGTHTGGAKPTEAEALYDAENFPGPFESTDDAPAAYKTVHSWIRHECAPQQVTGVNGRPQAQTQYKCTVTFSYSDERTPVAKATLGTGDTQDDAVAAARSAAQTSLLTNVQWAQPFCSTFSVTVKNPYKADYGHGTGTKKERWACEIDFIAAVR